MTEKTHQVVSLNSKQVILRPIEKTDLLLFQKWMNDQGTNKYLTSYLPKRIDDEEEWYKKTIGSSTDIVFSIVVGNKCIGTMGIHCINYRNGTAITGAFIGEAEYRCKGYGSEAKMLLLNYAFNTLNLRKIKSSVLDFNKRSAAYSKKCGYRVEGKLKKEVFINGRYADLIQLAVFKKWWEPLWKKFKNEKM